MLRLIGVLLLIPLLDMLLLVGLTQVVPWEVVVLAVVLTALVGMLLVRAEGRHTVNKIQAKLARGEVPTDELVDGALLLVAGASLLTPGLVTDALGFLIVIPLTRYPIRLGVKKWVVTPYVDARTGGMATGGVYVGGFPPQDGEGGMGAGSGGSSAGGVGGAGDGGTVDLGDDAYDVEDEDSS